MSFLTSDPTLRDGLYQCDVMRVAVQALGRRGLAGEVAVQSCLVCSDLMYHPFPLPDSRFVKQFLDARGPEAVLQLLDNRGSDPHPGLDSGKEMSHVPGQLQTRQQQADFNTTFILLPVMAMADSALGREWFSQTSHQQRLATHLRRVTSYRQLLQLVGVVQQEICTKEVKVDRVAVMERFLAFFSSLESKDHEEKVRQLLEQEEREKCRKEKKREKKRQQRLKQRMKAKAGDAADDNTGAGKDETGAADASRTATRSTEAEMAVGRNTHPLDTLDDIPLTVDPSDLQDVCGLAATGAALGPGQGHESQGGEDDWVMVGGKRCCPPKLKSHALIQGREVNVSDPVAFTGSVGVCRATPNHDDSTANTLQEGASDGNVLRNNEQASELNADCGLTGMMSDMNTAISKGGMRWADVARSGNFGTHSEDTESAFFSHQDTPAKPGSAVESSQSRKPPKLNKAHHVQLPSPGQQTEPTDDSSGQQVSLNTSQSGILEAAHQFLENLCNSAAFKDRVSAAAVGSCSEPCASRSSSNTWLGPSALYEALAGWMWQAAVAQGLVTPGADLPPATDVVTSFASQITKQTPVFGKLPSMSDSKSCSGGKSAFLASLEGLVSKQPSRLVSNVFNTLPSPSADVRDWFNATNRSTTDKCPHTRHSSSAQESAEREVLMRSKGYRSQTNLSAFTDGVSRNSQPSDSLRRLVSSTSTGRKIMPGLASTGQSDSDLIKETVGNRLPLLTTSTVLKEVSLSADSSELCGLSGIAGANNSTSAQFSCHGTHQPLAQRTSSLGSLTAHRPGCQHTSADKLLHVKPLEPTVQKCSLLGQLEVKREEHTWRCQEAAKTRIKTAVVSVPRSSNSDLTQSSLSDHRDDIFSLLSDASRCSGVNVIDSCHQLSPSNSLTSSLTSLHECLAPGFLRAAAGDMHTRFYSPEEDPEDTKEARRGLFCPDTDSLGCLPFPTGMTEAGLPSGSNFQNPDLPTVPDREHAGCPSTSLSLASRAVGHGRPQRLGNTQSETAPASSAEHVAVNPTTSPKGDSGSEETPTDTTSSSKRTTTPPPQTAATRPESPDVLFPESLRDDSGDNSGSNACEDERTKPLNVFPSIHDMTERDLFQDVFSNSYFLEQIAIDQIRRRLRAMGGEEDGEATGNSSVLYHDLDYYASLYGVRLRDVLGPKVGGRQAKADQPAGSRRADQAVPGWKVVAKELGRCMNGSKEDLREKEGEQHAEVSPEWEDPLLSAEWPWSCKVRRCVFVFWVCPLLFFLTASLA